MIMRMNNWVMINMPRNLLKFRYLNLRALNNQRIEMNHLAVTQLNKANLSQQKSWLLQVSRRKTKFKSNHLKLKLDQMSKILTQRIKSLYNLMTQRIWVFTKEVDKNQVMERWLQHQSHYSKIFRFQTLLKMIQMLR